MVASRQPSECTCSSLFPCERSSSVRHFRHLSSLFPYCAVPNLPCSYRLFDSFGLLSQGYCPVLVCPAVNLYPISSLHCPLPVRPFARSRHLHVSERYPSDATPSDSTSGSSYLMLYIPLTKPANLRIFGLGWILSNVMFMIHLHLDRPQAISELTYCSVRGPGRGYLGDFTDTFAISFRAWIWLQSWITC